MSLSADEFQLKSQIALYLSASVFKEFFLKRKQTKISKTYIRVFTTFITPKQAIWKKRTA